MKIENVLKRTVDIKTASIIGVVILGIATILEPAHAAGEDPVQASSIVGTPSNPAGLSADLAARVSLAGNRRHDTPVRHPGVEPNVITGPLIYGGGAVQTAPVVYVVYWGWKSDPNGEQAYLNDFLSTVGGTPWLNTVAQYSGAGNPANLYAGSWSDSSSVPTQPTDAQIQAEALAAVRHFGLGTEVNIQIVVATPTGHSTAGFGTTFCAYHGPLAAKPNVTYTNLPYMTDAGFSCGENSVRGPLDGVSIVEGHELAESITDPLITAWIDAARNEIGDKCAWSDLSTVTTSLGTFAVQPLWSNAANGCALSTKYELSPPAVAITAGAYTYLFWKGSDANLWQAQGSAKGSLGTPINRGMGPLGSNPAVGVDATGATYAYWEGTDRNLYEAYWNGSAWVGPYNRHMGPLNSPPTVAITAAGEAYVFWKGTDNNLYEAQGPAKGQLSGPYNRGMGPLGSAPAVGVDANGAIYVYWEGTDSNLWEAYWNGSAWAGPYNKGMGPLNSPPAVAVSSKANAYVFWEGTDSNLWEAQGAANGSLFGPYNRGMGALGSAPAAGIDANGATYVYWGGLDLQAFWEAYWNGSAWVGPYSRGQ